MADPFEVEVTRTAYGHLAAQRRYGRNAILDAIKEQLTHTPVAETLNRKMIGGEEVTL